MLAYPVIVKLPTNEYAEVCGAIRTKYANKIPNKGNMLHGNHFYVYTHSRYSHKIVCMLKIEIEGNEDFIARKMKEDENDNRNNKSKS